MIESTFGNLVLAGSIVDVDGTIFVQLGIFLVFWLLIYLLVVKPMVRVHQTRFSRMAGARQEAEAMDLRAARAHTDYEEQIAEKRHAAVAIRDGIREAALAKRRATVEGARSEVTAAAQAAQAELDASRETALGAVNQEADVLADLIVDRLLGKGE